MIFKVKPNWQDEKGIETFDCPKEAIDYIEEKTGSKSLGENLVERVEEWTWIDKIVLDGEWNDFVLQYGNKAQVKSLKKQMKKLEKV